MTTYDGSRTIYDRAALIPGRSLTRSKAPGRLFPIGSGPLYAEASARGYALIDADGDHYVDMLCGLGAIAIGHNRPEIVEAACAAIRNGWTLSLPSELEARAAEMVTRHISPWATAVRFVKTGSEATHAALRIAYAATGRTGVLVGDWAYHGWHEWAATRAPRTEEETLTATRAQLDSPTRTFTHGCDLDAAIPFPEQYAALFLEPHRWASTDPEWVRAVRQWCTKHGIVLVFDDMIWGGRVRLGGSPEYFEVTPDLACYGKAFGNGAPIAFVVGRDLLAEHGEIVSGTYSGDTAALAALIEAVKIYATEPIVEILWQQGDRLAVGLDEVRAWWHANRRDDQPQMFVEGFPVHQRIRFDAPGWGPRLSGLLAGRRILQHPDCINLTAAHTSLVIDRVVDATYAAVKDLRDHV